MTQIGYNYVGSSAKNAVVMSNCILNWGDPNTYTGMLDRSPCGTGTCAVMAKRFADNELGLEEDFVHESIIGSQFIGRLISETKVIIIIKFMKYCEHMYILMYYML